MRLPKKKLTADDIKTETIDLGWKKKGRKFSDWKKDPAKVTKMRMSDNRSISIITEDDTIGKFTPAAKFANAFIKDRFIFPFYDRSDFFFNSNEEAQELLDDLKITVGEVLPTSYNTWGDMTTDESLTRIFFYGMGVVLVAMQLDGVKSDLGPFVVEMPLEDFEYRRGFRPLGATIYFDIDQKPSAIFDPIQKEFFRPDEPGWEEAKFLVRVTVGTLVTMREHLLWSHLLLSNSVTKASINDLPPCHPIRRLLTIFTFSTNIVNTDAFGALVPRDGIFHRVTGFKYKSMKDMFDAYYKASNIFEPFVDRKVSSAVQELSDKGKFPYLSEGIAYYKVVHEFVNEWLDAADYRKVDAAAKAFYDTVKEDSKGQMYVLPEFKEGDDMLINLLSQMIFVVTAYHEVTGGGVTDYFRLPTRFGFRCTKNATQMDAQSFLTATMIAGSTSVTMPFLMCDFKNFFGAGGAPGWERDVWNKFLGKLEILSKAVKTADANREIEYKAFDPEILKCSISM